LGIELHGSLGGSAGWRCSSSTEIRSGRTHEGHAPVARRPADQIAKALHARANSVDVLDLEGEVTEVAAACVGLRLAPVTGQLDLGLRCLSGREKNQGVATLKVLAAPGFLKPQAVAEKAQRRSKIADANHRMKVAHRRFAAKFC